MFKEQLHESFDAISPSPELLDRISAMMSEEAARPKTSIKMNAVKYGGIAAALALAAGGTFAVMQHNGSIARTASAAPTEAADMAAETEAPGFVKEETTAAAAATTTAPAYPYGVAEEEAEEDMGEAIEESFMLYSATDDETGGDAGASYASAAEDTAAKYAVTADNEGADDGMQANDSRIMTAGDGAYSDSTNDGSYETYTEDEEEADYDEMPAVGASEVSAGSADGDDIPGRGDENDANPGGGSPDLTDKDIIIDGTLCHVLSLSPIDAVVWDGNKYVSIYSGNETDCTKVIKAENLVGSVIRTEGEPVNELETSFFLDADLYRGDGLEFLAAKSSEEILRDMLNTPALQKIEGIESYTTDNVLLIYPVYRDSDYPDHDFVGSPAFYRYLPEK